MRQPQHKILFLATEYESGMRSYAHTIIHNMWNERAHAIVVIKDNKYKQDFTDLDQSRIHFITYPTNKLKKMWFRFFSSHLTKAIKQIATDFNISVIYSLTGELMLCNTIQSIQKSLPVLYTVHDAIPHDTKQPILSLLKERLIVTWPQRHLLRKTPYKVTNSHSQLHYIKQHYKWSHTYYAPFPTLVSNDIATGNLSVPETAKIDNYILFFGRIDLYKGVHLLHKCYCEHPGLQNRALVLAGAGHYYFSPELKNGNAVVINRFIDDKEVADLFSKAAVVVYPYISATQSGVISIASYFKKPIVLSDVPYFKEVASDQSGVYFFRNGDTDDMAKSISKAVAENRSTESLYEHIYKPANMANCINSIINDIAKKPQ